MMVTIVTFILGLAVVTAGGSGWGAEPEEMIPDENDHLTLQELRWCTFESARLDGESDELNAYAGWEVDGYNTRISHYNNRCSDKRYYERDETRVERELTTGKRQTLQEQGALRLRKARLERETRRSYVDSEMARVLSAPHDSATELGRVPRWGELIKTGRAQGAWFEVEWQTPSLDNVLKFGWVLGGLLEDGSGMEARFRYCEGHVRRPLPEHNYFLSKLDLQTNSEFAVENGLRDDAYVKLVRERDKAVASLYVAAGKTALLKGIPEGSYMVAFGTGSIFDRDDASFCIRGVAQKFERQIDYDVHTASWELTLQAVSGGNARTHSMNYDDFDKL